MTTLYLWVKDNLQTISKLNGMQMPIFFYTSDSSNWTPNNAIYNEYLTLQIIKTEISRQESNLENILIPKSKRLIKELIATSKNDYESKCKIKNEINLLEKQINYLDNNIKLLLFYISQYDFLRQQIKYIYI